VASGKTLDLSLVRRPVLDKHSSGGVGDKVTLVLGPAVAAAGGVFGKMSGRGLGHTGGTLDKLESIPGFKVQLSQGEFIRQLERVGVAVIGQSERLVPADRILYALRDVTATVDNEGLIAASIMAKKIASGTAALVLDIKVGRGAFLQTLEQARSLGRLCQRIGEAFGRRVACLYTSMDAPLGRAVGNRLEVEEAWEVLTGSGPEDVRQLVVELGGALLALADLNMDEETGRAAVAQALRDGRAADRFQQWCAAQGGRWRPGEFHRLGGADVVAPRSGFLTAADALAVGRAAMLAGAGRGRADDEVDSAAGVMLHVGLNEPVEVGQSLATVYARQTARRAEAVQALSDAFTVGDEPVSPTPRVLARD
jgi:pyrimidine-nucleoside phosphorylase